jgi:hypothetical protein
MSLRTALEKAQSIWNAQQKHSAHIEAVLTTIGYSKKTGPALRAIAALNQFGLTRETGSVDSRMVALSELAINYLLSNDAQQRDQLLRQAALKPAIFQHLWEHYGAFLPSDDTIKNHLIRDKNFNATAVGELISNYRDTFDFSKLRGNGGEDEKTPINPPTATPPSPVGTPPVVAQKHKEGGLLSMTQGLRYLSIPLEIGEAPVPLGMSKEDWEMFINTLKLWKSRILKSPEESSPDADSALDELAQD